MIRALLPSDPRYPEYDLAQRRLCLALNPMCHPFDEPVMGNVKADLIVAWYELPARDAWERWGQESQ